MNSRYKSVMAAGLVVAAGAGVWLATSSDGPHSVTPRPAARRELASSRPAVEWRRPERAPSPPAESCGAECVEQARKAARDARVEAALARLERRTGHITREIIEQEQEHLAATAQALHARETEMPVIGDEVDETGARWRKLAYADGAVRYALPEEP